LIAGVPTAWITPTRCHQRLDLQAHEAMKPAQPNRPAIRRRIVEAFIVALLIATGGCRSGGESFHQARHAFVVGDLETADTVLRELSQGPRSTRLPSELDLAMVELAAGNATAAESRLRRLRDQFDALPQRVSIDDAASLATDDNARLFQIADYEQVLLRSLLAICSLAGDQIDAEAYCLQAQIRQAELRRLAEENDSLPTGVPQIALAPYLRGTLREATHQNYDDAERAFRLVSSIRPEFAPSAEDIQRVTCGAHSRSGHGVLYGFAFVGQGPRLVESIAPTTTTSLQIASTLLRTVEKQENEEGDALVLPNIASVKVPTVEIPPSEIAAVGFSIDGRFLGASQTLTDIGQLATEKVDAEMPWTIARAVARRVLKETGVAATSRTLGLRGDAANAFEFAAINAWSGIETADTRCWSLLPREIQVFRVELPVGNQTISFLPLAHNGQAIAAVPQKSVTIEDGRNHYVVIIAPQTIVSVLP
jgi:hypothetical protein